MKDDRYMADLYTARVNGEKIIELVKGDWRPAQDLLNLNCKVLDHLEEFFYKLRDGPAYPPGYYILYYDMFDYLNNASSSKVEKALQFIEKNYSEEEKQGLIEDIFVL